MDACKRLVGARCHTGEIAWRARTALAAFGTPVPCRARVCVPVEMQALPMMCGIASFETHTGRQAWVRYVASQKNICEPRWLPAHNLLLVCCDNVLMALDAATGADVWEYRAPRALSPSAPAWSPRLGAVIVTECITSHVHAVSARAGERRWHATLPGLSWSSNSPACHAGLALHAANPHGVSARDITTGRVVWERHDIIEDNRLAYGARITVA